LDLYLQDKPVANDVNINAIARSTPGFNGAGTCILVCFITIQKVVLPQVYYVMLWPIFLFQFELKKSCPHIIYLKLEGVHCFSLYKHHRTLCTGIG
jgi:hypothetical protein